MIDNTVDTTSEVWTTSCQNDCRSLSRKCVFSDTKIVVKKYPKFANVGLNRQKWGKNVLFCLEIRFSSYLKTKILQHHFLSNHLPRELRYSGKSHSWWVCCSCPFSCLRDRSSNRNSIFLSLVATIICHDPSVLHPL